MSIFPTKILLSTDASEDADLATRAAIELSDETGSELCVVHVEPLVPLIFDSTELDPERAKRKAQKLIEEQIERIEDAGGTASEAYLKVGNPAERIVALAEELGAGLVVVGSRGLGPLKWALMGSSVSGSVVRHAHCPVLVVRELKETARVDPSTAAPTGRLAKAEREGEESTREGTSAVGGLPYRTSGEEARVHA
jgi:nucleotide-binding universal stress UspA family protein